MIYNLTEDNTEIDNESKLVFSLTKFHRYYIKILTTIGIIGNIVSIIILIRIYLKRNSNICIPYTILCGLNLINIIYKNLGLIKFKFNLSPQAIVFTQNSLVLLVVWMQVVISLHRFIYVVFQQKAKIFDKKVFKMLY